MYQNQNLLGNDEQFYLDNIKEHIFQAVKNNINKNNILDFMHDLIKELLTAHYISSVEIHLNWRSSRILAGYGQRTKLGEFRIELTDLKNLLFDNCTVYHTKREPRTTNIFPEIKVPITIYNSDFGELKINLKKFPKHSRHDGTNQQLKAGLLDLKLESLLDKLNSEKIKEENLNQIESIQCLKEQISALSKELYTVTAISANLHPKISIKNFIEKSLKKLNEIFKCSIMALFIYNEEYSCCNFSEFVPQVDKDLEEKLYNIFHNKFFFDAHRFIKPTVIKKDTTFWNKYYKSPETEKYELIICNPIQAQKISTGIIFLLYEQNVQYSQEDFRLLAGISNIIGTAIENKILFVKSQRKLLEEEFLYQSINQFHKQMSLEKALKAICKKSIESFDQYTSSYLFTNSDTPLVKAGYCLDANGLTIKAHAYQQITLESLRRFQESLYSYQEALLISDMQTLKHDMQGLEHFCTLGTNSLMVVPLHKKTGLKGWLVLINTSGSYSFTHSDLSLLVAMVSGASIAIENIKHLREAQQGVSDLQDKLNRSNQQINKLHASQQNRIENRKDIVFWINTDHIIVFANKAMEELTGYSKTQLYNFSKSPFDFINRQNYDYLNENFSQILNKEKSIIADIECIIIDSHEEERWFSLMLLPLKDEEDNIIGVESIGRDLTEEKRLEQEANRNKELALLGEFSSAMAHQLRNPLGNILMGTKRLQRALENHPKANHQNSLSPPISDIINEIYNMNQIITELTEYTKSLNLRKTDQDLQLILEEAQSAFREIIEQSGILVQKSFPEQPVVILADSVLLTQAIQNIIHNALQAMPAGGVLSLCISLSQIKKGYVQVAIKDTGQGLAADKLHKIFHPFYTTKEKGTGLGLSLSYRIIQAHQGLIWAQQNKNNGMTINILLPDKTSSAPIYQRQDCHADQNPCG